ncbi:protein ELYS homolog [Aedes albopictus]|uniref:ELYS-like domain-containing protein n=1 Tax=Aedes albopictus TaxID=7160 RepID=A0ABM1YD95_AEDAL
MMWSNEIHLKLKNVVEIRHQELPERRSGSSSSSDSSLEEAAAAPQGSIGGFLKDGSLGWIARGSMFSVFSTQSGSKLMSHNFEQDSKTRNCIICSAEEMPLEETNCCVVAVAIQLDNDTGIVVVLTVQGSRLLGRIDINEKVSCLRPVSRLSYNRGRLAEFSGCLAVGTASGKVLLVDACLKFDENPIFGRRLVMNKLDRNQCHIEFSSTDAEQITASHALIRTRDVYFGLQLDSLEEEAYSPVTSLLDLPALMAVAVGYADGRMVIYDLLELRVIHVAHPPVEDSPVISMNMIEPTNDPKACVYIWAFHAGEDGSFAVLHTLMYEEKFVEPHGHVYEGFISCGPRLTIPSNDQGSFPLSVQSIMKTVSQEEEVLTLSVLSWIGSDKATNIVVFDLNQWYKAEMPHTCNWRQDLNHTVVFSVKDFSVNVCLVADSLVPFNSIQRPEEHFYPNSLSFDMITLTNDNCARYHWTGLQNKIIEYFERSGSACIMDPGKIYTVMLRAALMPQFPDFNYSTEAPLDVQREYLLSVALEYNCYSLLQECALSWADGSHLGQTPEEGVALSTLTDWIWSRAKALKELSNNMCVPLFDLSGRRIDCGTQKTLLHCSRQLRQLSKLYDVIFTQCKQYIPEKVFKALKAQGNSIQLAADYQEVVQWLLNVGLLPEGNIDGVNLSDEFLLVPFPYQAIRSYYASQRTMLHDKQQADSKDPTSVEDLSCKYLFIDNFIEREFPNEALRKMWIENNSTGVYPPNSMQNLLRALLVPNVSAEVKYVLLCYTFMDMTAVLGEGRYSGIVQNLIKFPAVFKLSSALIKRTQAFWFLDHGHIDGAIEELLSPMSQSEQFPHWQREFLISALLRYDAPHLALRALRVPGMPINPFLELRTLLENNLISEAFKLQRSKHDKKLLKCFFEGTLRSSKYEVLLDLAMSEEETRILREYLTSTHQPMADNVHFIHLLQKLDFVEAVHMVDRLGRKRTTEYNLEAPKEALTLYHAALEPTTQHLSYLAYAEQKDLRPTKAPFAEPLSSRLIQSRADFRNRIYHKSILAIKEAAAPLDHPQPFLEKPGLGMFQFHAQTKSSKVCYPIKLVSKVSKRKLDEDNMHEAKEKVVPAVFLDYEKPSKRRKVETENPYNMSFVAPKSVLTEFRPMKPWFKFSSHNSERSSSKSFSRSPSAQLTTPVVKKMSSYNPPSPESVSSYTPHGILKSTASVQSFFNRKSVSPTPTGTPPTIHRISDAEEKILRFDLPESPQVENLEPSFAASSQLLNESMVSNDEFFSPEVSVATLDDETCMDIKNSLSAGPKRRRSIHSRSRSITPVENNIAIIIEDPDDDSSSKQPDSQDMDESMESAEMGPDDPETPPLPTVMLHHGSHAGKSLERMVLEANARRALVAEMAVGEIMEDTESELEIQVEEKLEVRVEVSLPESEGESVEEPRDEPVLAESVSGEQFVEKCASEAAQDVPSEEASAPERVPEPGSEQAVVVLDEDEEEDDVQEVLPEQDVSDDYNDESHGEEEELDLVVEEASAEEDIEMESDVEEIHEDDVDNSEASEDSSAVEEVINISSGSESAGNISSGSESDDESSSSSTSDDKGDDEEKQAVGGERTVGATEPAGPSTEEPAENRQLSDFYSDIVPEFLMDQGNVEDKAKNEESSDVQVSTTTSSTSHTDSESRVREQQSQGEVSVANSEDDDGSNSNKGHQAEDLSVQQEAVEQAEVREQTPEPSTSRARDLSVPAGNERQDQPAVVSDNKIVSPSREESFKHANEDKFLGPPKNAHEVEVPAMNLSVKPDVAHEANRKNSKSDESDDSAALNLSTGQSVERLQPDEEVSESDTADVDESISVEERTNSSPQQRAENADVEDPLEGPSSRIIAPKSSTGLGEQEQPLEAPNAEATHDVQNVESKEDSEAIQDTVPKETATSPSKEVSTPAKRARKASTGSVDVSTPRSTIKTRRMSAAEHLEDTPTKRTTRASSLAPEGKSPETPLSKSRKHSSMTNVATPELTTLTPRRSTRASSLARELLTSTPARRTRRTTETSTESKHLSPEEANDSIVDDSKSEVSNVSTGSRRNTRRSTAARKLPLQPTISEESTDMPSPKASKSSSGKVEEESFAEYSTNRRLTRHQSAIIEKSLDMVRKLNASSEDATHSVSYDEADSEPESVVSNASTVSKRSTRSKASQQSKGGKSTASGRGKAKPTTSASGRSTRSSAASKRDNSDADSVDTDIAESPAKKSKLETIAEEDDEPAMKGRRRGKPKKV